MTFAVFTCLILRIAATKGVGQTAKHTTLYAFKTGIKVAPRGAM